MSSTAADVARDLYERHARQVYSICLRQLGSREEAEDAAQTVFLNAFGALRRGSRPRFERAWLRTIAENVCHDRRARAPRTRDLHALADVLASPEREPGALAGIEHALAQLPDTQRRAIVLREWHGLSYREIAAELGLSAAAAEAVAFRARRTLAERLRSRGNLSLLGWLKPALSGSAAVAKLSVVVGVAALATG
ncbi:MAG: sigma-70 family RNA polymerase sigma factor, partial [Actinomycetota bacterium]|nr:sigma-70 family RNA polymerase sigma factor [Actinomycetota bacterium]